MKLFTEGLFNFKKTLLTTILLNTLTILFVFLNQQKLPPFVPLYYGNPAGEEQLGTALGLSIPPFFVLVATLTAIVITKTYKDSFLENLLMLSIVIFTLLSIVAVFKIIFLVGYF